MSAAETLDAKESMSLEWLDGFQSAIEYINLILWPVKLDASAITELDQKLAELHLRIRELRTQRIAAEVLFL